MRMIDDLTRFWSKVDIALGDGCWEWNAGCSGDGYGAFKVGGRQWGSHRYAYSQYVGFIPVGMKVCHRCDNPKCVRVDHLFLGTAADNMRDKAVKLRSSIGVKNPRAKLTEAQVSEIKRRVGSGESQRSVARDLGVNHLTVFRIFHNHAWRHIR